MFKKSLLLTLLMALFTPLAMHAQQALPYEYGFEASLANAGWTLSNASNSGISSNSTAIHSGSYGFMFNYSDEGAYLMSPILTGGDRGIVVSFYYKVYSSNYVDHFKVGYTTDATVTDPSEFTYGAQVTTGTTSWQEYTETLPAGTVRMAIFYDDGNYDDGYYLFLDDFSFEAYSNCAKPTDLAIDYTEGASRATVTWRSEVGSYNVMVNGVSVAEGLSEASYVIRNIELVNNYTVSVQADCGEEQSGWVSETFFSGCTETFAIPYAYGFESTADINCWTLSPEDNMSIDTDPDFAHSGDNFFIFNYTQNPPQYLISPELSGIQNGLHVEFYYSGYSQGEETFQVGYSITDNDPESFTWGDEITASSSYQRFSANYPAETKYVAVKHTSDYQWYFFLDDFLFEESASCLEPSAVQVADVTTTGANISWTAGGEEGAWDIYVTDGYDDVPDETTTPTYANVDNNTSYPIGDLDPATIYYVYVRAICDEASAWSSPATFNTECESMALPYSEDFADGELSVCWSTINNNTSYNNVSIMALSETLNVLAFARQSSTGDLIAVLPEVDENYPLNGYQISFYACYANYSGGSMTSGALSIGVMTDPNDASTFEEVEALTITDAYQNFGAYTVRLNTYTGTGRYLALKNTHTQNGFVLVALIEVTELPACLEPTDLAVEGGKNAIVTWEGEGESFDVALTTSYDEDTVIEDYIVGNTTDNEFNLSEYTAVGDNYVFVRANCGTDGYSEWVGAYFDVNYCTPNPTSHDGTGITGVSFGTGDYVVTNGDGSASLPASAPYYGDYTSMIGAVQAGVESTIAITTGTGNWPYTFVIWVDLDNSMTFDDSEVLYIGKASSGTGTLNATITVPATQELGDYRMRIYGADSYFTSFYGNGTTNWDAAHDPCAAGTYRHAHDYTLRVLEAPSCLAAADVTVDPENITSTSAVITWTNNNGADATYTVMQGETVLTTDAVNSYTLEGLTAATTYPAGTFTIISDCDETAVANVPAFSTLCDDITTLPWSEDFESFANNTVPVCWDNSASTSTTVSTSPYYIWGVVTVSDNNMLKMENYWAQSGTALINTPTIVLPAEGTYQLSFDYAHNASCGAFKVNVSKDNGATWTELASYTKGSGSSHTEPGDFTPATISLADYAGESIILQFFANANYGNGAIFVDNIQIALISTFTKTIQAYNGNGGYYLIASPVDGVNPAEIGMITDELGSEATPETSTYDLYWFNQSQDLEWQNYRAEAFNLASGTGYLYASKGGVDITITGVANTNGEVSLAYDATAELKGWNLVGNPFGVEAYIDKPFYILENSADYTPKAAGERIEVMQGLLVETTEATTLTFSTESSTGKDAKLAMNVNKDNKQLDNAIIVFGGNQRLSKLNFRPNSSKLYMPVEGKDYAVASAENQGEMPVYFKAEDNGTYTLSFNAQEVEFSYLHLIDNLTGNEVDLLENPSYSFDARTTDYASRFKLVFATGNSNGSENNFGFISDGNLMILGIEGEATLQVIDVTGRILSTETFSGNYNKAVNEATGIYMLRLIQGSDVRTQKIVIK